MSSALHHGTPALIAIDSRGHCVRNIACHRAEAIDSAPLDLRINQQVFDARGRLAEQCDPRLFENRKRDPQQAPNQVTHYGLSGQVLKTLSVDAGCRVAFTNTVGQVLDHWDGRGTHQQREYDECMRPAAHFERELGGMDRRCSERFTYAGASSEDAKRNRCGRMIRHDDPAGTQWHESFDLLAQPTNARRQFLQALAVADWPELIVDRVEQLETRKNQNAEGVEVLYSWSWKRDALGTVTEQTDAVGNVQRFEMDITGRPAKAYLNDVTLLKLIDYDALGRVAMELTGNDVTTTLCYSAVDGHLNSHQVRKADGKWLLHLQYQHDPVGNVERIEDLAQPVKWDAGRVAAVSSYTYDTLYQLISASGRENANQTIGPALPCVEIFGSGDDSRWRNYTQIFNYDSGGNLTDLVHKVNGSVVSHRTMAVDNQSNRSLFKGNEDPPVDFCKGFDANGNQQALAPGQVMRWDARNQLRQVTQVVREEPNGRDDDVETYVYDGGGQRVRKVRRLKIQKGEQVSEVRYLPGLEIRTLATGEHLHVVTIQAGYSGVRLFHWEANKPDEVENNQLRYSVSDHVGSITLELSQEAELISHESYYAYGGTAWWAARNAVEAKYKTVRYSAKERDATGLYYYGYRYYAPWLQRWINPDPARDVDGLNLYRMTRNNPIMFCDLDGRASKEKSLADSMAAAKVVDLFDNLSLGPNHQSVQKATGLEDLSVRLRRQAISMVLEARVPGSVVPTLHKFMMDEYWKIIEGGGGSTSFVLKGTVDKLYAYSILPGGQEIYDANRAKGMGVGESLKRAGINYKVIFKQRQEPGSSVASQSPQSSSSFEVSAQTSVQRHKVEKQSGVNIDNQASGVAGVADSSAGKGVEFVVVNPGAFDNDDLPASDRRILNKAIEGLRDQKIGYKLDGTNELVVDLAGFRGDRGRGRYRLAFEQNGTQRRLTRIVNPHI